jgi:hypothetical protein
VAISMRRPLTPKEQDLLMILLNMMRTSAIRRAS